MTYAPNDFDTIPALPAWVTFGRGETLGDVAFRSGAALAHLSSILQGQTIPLAVLRERLALNAAEAAVIRSGRPERAADLRDAVHLLRPSEQPGPAGAVLVAWQAAVAQRVTKKKVVSGTPIAAAAVALEAVRAAAPRDDVGALIAADQVLSSALGFSHTLPLLGPGLDRAALRIEGEELHRACHRAVVSSVEEALRLARALARRAAQLRALAPKLRAKGSARALEMFLTRDALAPSLALTPFMSDRAARRLCDRLVDLGAVRELTGRETFRLYGL